MSGLKQAQQRTSMVTWALAERRWETEAEASLFGQETKLLRSEMITVERSSPILSSWQITLPQSEFLRVCHKSTKGEPMTPFFSSKHSREIGGGKRGILRYRAFFERRCVQLGALFFPPARAGKRRVAFRPSAPKGIPPPNDRSLSPSPSLFPSSAVAAASFSSSSLSGKLRNRPREGEERAEEAPLLICHRCLLQASQAVKNAIWIMSQP